VDTTKKRKVITDFFGTGKKDNDNDDKEEDDEENVKKESVETSNTGTLADYLTDPQWRSFLDTEFQKSYFKKIEEFVEKEYNSEEIFPPKDEIFNAFNITPLDNVKIVILGQDPYIKKNQAHGLSFSVRRGIKAPPSLVRIYKVLEKQIDGFAIPDHGCLDSWAKQGVLMLNAVLTVRSGKSNSHKDCGWATFTDAVIKKLSQEKEGLIFFLWGKFAERKKSLISKQNNHYTLIAPHPSPMSGEGWLSCTHFKEANELLTEKMEKIQLTGRYN